MMFNKGSLVAIKNEELIRTNRQLQGHLLSPHIKSKLLLGNEIIVCPYVRIVGNDMFDNRPHHKDNCEGVLVQTLVRKNDCVSKGIWFFRPEAFEILSEEERQKIEAEWNAFEL